jgi:hypothetical protein
MKPINSFFSNSKTNNENDETQIIATLCAKSAISFKQASSDPLWNLVYFSMNKMNNFLPEESKIIVQNIMKKPSRKKVAEIVKMEGEKKKLINLQNKEGKYGVLAFDGAEIGHCEYYVGILYFPCLQDESVVVCFKNNIRSQEDIAEACSETLMNISKHVSIINFVVDGLKHQYQALSLAPSSKLANFQDYLEDFSFPLPFILPDIPHIIQLSLRNAADSESIPLKGYLAEIDSPCATIRKPEAVSLIGSRCPSFPKTRFFYSVLLMTFLVKHQNKIISFYESNFNLEEVDDAKILFVVISQLLVVLKPMFIVLTYYEKEKGCSETVFIYFFFNFTYL